MPITPFNMAKETKGGYLKQNFIRRKILETAGIPYGDELPDVVISLEDMKQAIKEVDSELSDENVESSANHIMGFFGYQDGIIDNILETEDRDVFYIFEDAGLLKTAVEETTLYSGEEWKIHYWILRKTKIIELAGKSKNKYEAGEKKDNIYEKIPDEIWERPKPKKVPDNK